MNVLDIAQTIINGFFNMMLIVDYSDFQDPFDGLLDGLETLGQVIGGEFGGLMDCGPLSP